jgi:hypothetical protein
MPKYENRNINGNREIILLFLVVSLWIITLLGVIIFIIIAVFLHLIRSYLLGVICIVFVHFQKNIWRFVKYILLRRHQSPDQNVIIINQ